MRFQLPAPTGPTAFLRLMGGNKHRARGEGDVAQASEASDHIKTLAGAGFVPPPPGAGARVMRGSHPKRFWSEPDRPRREAGLPCAGSSYEPAYDEVGPGAAAGEGRSARRGAHARLQAREPLVLAASSWAA